MRHSIETAPRDEKVVILEDDTSGIFDVAHWLPEAGKWVDKNGEPTRITPTHWSPLARDKYLLHGSDGSSNPSRGGPAASRSRWRFAASSITAALVAAALVGIYFPAEVAAYVTRYAGLQDFLGISRRQVVEQEAQSPSQDSRKTNLSALQQQGEADQAYAQEAAQAKQAREAFGPEARQSLETEQRTGDLANELAEARRAIKRLNLQLRAGAANSAQLLRQERERTAAALVQEAIAAQQALTASDARDRRALDEERARGAALASELATARREIEANVALLNKTRDDAAQFKQTAEKPTAEMQQERDRAEAGAAKSAQLLGQERQEAAVVRQELTASTVEHRHALDEERARGAALASGLALAQREIETQAALLRKASDETGQLKQAEAAKSAQSLEQERQKTAALAQEAAAARQELTTSTAQHRQALNEERARSAALTSEFATAQREIEMQAVQLRKASDETRQLKPATESAMAELRQSLQEERNRTEATARESAQRAINACTTLERTAKGQITQVTQAVEAAAPEQPAAAVSQSGPEVARLMVRARALLGQGNIGAARIVLERAAETGSAQASFMLAETYDPVILSAWGTYGTRGEASKARELYAKAHAGGIQEAKNRFDALDQ
jgi:hypothetical protein